jgi:outer membrane immunogenic protein
VEGDFQRTDASESRTNEDFVAQDSAVGQTQGFGTSETNVTFVRRAETDWTASARGRLGFACGRFLFYGTGGAAFADLDVGASDTAATNGFVGGQLSGSDFDSNRSSDDDTVCGWTAGGGAEWAITRWLSLGVEYRHSDFGSTRAHFNSDTSAITPSSMNVDLESDQVTFRVNVLVCNLFGNR